MDAKQAREHLLQARTPQQRQRAVRDALQAGLPIERIEDILDWLDQVVVDERHESHPSHPAEGPESKG